MNNKGFAITTILYGLLLLFLMLMLSLLGILSSYRHKLSILIDNTNGARDIINNSSSTSTAYAVYSSSDNSLRFYRSTTPITIGSTYNGKIVTNVYTGFENATYSLVSDVPWADIVLNVTKVYFEDTIKPISTKYWFYGFKNTSMLDVTKLNTSNVTNMYGMFWNTGYSSSVNSFKIKGTDDWDTSKVANMNYLFSKAGAYATTWDIGNLSNWNTKNVYYMTALFRYAGGQSDTLNLDLSNWDVSKVGQMEEMFYSAGIDADNWYIGDLSRWDVSKVRNMRKMFMSAGGIGADFNLGDLSGWNTSNVENMYMMFQMAGMYADYWYIGDVSLWNTVKVTDMSYMFNASGCLSGTKYDLSGWNVSKVTAHTDFNTNISCTIVEPIWN